MRKAGSAIPADSPSQRTTPLLHNTPMRRALPCHLPIPELPTSGIHIMAFRAALAERMSILQEGQGLFVVDAREKAELEVLLDHITLSLQSQWRWQEAEDLARVLLAL